MAKVTGFFHAGITVRDMDVSLPFYRDGLGLEVAFERVLGADYLRTVLALPLSGEHSHRVPAHTGRRLCGTPGIPGTGDGSGVVPTV